MVDTTHTPDHRAARQSSPPNTHFSTVVFQAELCVTVAEWLSLNSGLLCVERGE